MINNEKGTDHKESAPKQAQSYLSKIRSTCLTLFIISILCMFVGQYKSNDRMLSVGIGMSISVAMVEITINLSDESEDDDE